MSLGWKKFQFLTREDKAEADLPADVCCSSIGRDEAFFGCRRGDVVSLDRSLRRLRSFEAHGHSLMHVHRSKVGGRGRSGVWGRRVRGARAHRPGRHSSTTAPHLDYTDAQTRDLLLTVGCDTADDSSACLRVWSLEGAGEGGRPPTQVKTCVRRPSVSLGAAWEGVCVVIAVQWRSQGGPMHGCARARAHTCVGACLMFTHSKAFTQKTIPRLESTPKPPPTAQRAPVWGQGAPGAAAGSGSARAVRQRRRRRWRLAVPYRGSCRRPRRAAGAHRRRWCVAARALVQGGRVLGLCMRRFLMRREGPGEAIWLLTGGGSVCVWLRRLGFRRLPRPCFSYRSSEIVLLSSCPFAPHAQIALTPHTHMHTRTHPTNQHGTACSVRCFCHRRRRQNPLRCCSLHPTAGSLPPTAGSAKRRVTTIQRRSCLP